MRSCTRLRGRPVFYGRVHGAGYQPKRRGDLNPTRCTTLISIFRALPDTKSRPLALDAAITSCNRTGLVVDWPAHRYSLGRAGRDVPRQRLASHSYRGFNVQFSSGSASTASHAQHHHRHDHTSISGRIRSPRDAGLFTRHPIGMGAWRQLFTAYRHHDDGSTRTFCTRGDGAKNKT